MFYALLSTKSKALIPSNTTRFVAFRRTAKSQKREVCALREKA